MGTSEKWLERVQFIYEDNKPIMKIISEFISVHQPPVKDCEMGVYRKYISRLTFFANCVYLDKNGRTNAEKNVKYDLSQFDVWQRLDISPFDIMEIKERTSDPTDADVTYISKWAKNYPEDEGILDYYAGVLSTSSRFIEAEEILNKIFELYPEKKSHDALNTRLHMKIQGEWDLEKALSIADEGLAIYPTSFDFIIAKAKVLKWFGDETGCKDYLKRAEELDRKRFRNFMKNHWIDAFPEQLKAERFMHIMNEIKMLLGKGQQKEAYALFGKARRLCPNLKEPKRLLFFMDFTRVINENRLAEAQELSSELTALGKDEVASFSEALIEYRKGNLEAAVIKALESGKLASKKKARYFLPSLELLEEIYRKKNDYENEKRIRVEIAKAREYFSTRFRP